MKTVLSIETSVPHASVALWRDGEVIFEEGFITDRKHNSMIFETLERALSMLDDVTSLSLVIVGTGPGSYSGTRVGIAAGQGIAIAHGCPSVGVGSMAATPEARRAHKDSPRRKSMAVGDARRGLYFISRVSSFGESMEPELMDASGFMGLVSDEEKSETTLFTFDDPQQLCLGDELTGKVTQTHPTAKGLIDIWSGLSEERRKELITTPLSPAYLRPPFTSKAKGGHPLLRS